MAANGFANGHISTANGHLSSDDEEIDLRDNKYAVVATSPQKRNCAESDPERDSIEDPESGPENDLPARHQKATARRPYEEDMEVDEEDDLEMEIACLKEDDTDSDRDEVDDGGEDEDFKDIGDEKGGGGVQKESELQEEEEELSGMTSAEEHAVGVQYADPAISCATVSSTSSGSGGGGAVAGGGGAQSGGVTEAEAFPPHANGSSVPAADVVLALEGPHDHPTGAEDISSSSSRPRRSSEEEDQQQQEEEPQQQTPQTVITTPLGRSTSPDRLPSFHHTQEVEGPRPPLRYSPDPQHLSLQEEEEPLEEEPAYTGPSTPPASPANAPATSHPAGCPPLVAPSQEPIDNRSVEESRTDTYNDQLSGGFLQYLGTRMERSNSVELEKRDEEKAGDVPAAVDGASGEADVGVKNVDFEGKPRADGDDDDEKDVDTAASGQVADGDDDAEGKSPQEQEQEVVGDGEATTESLEQTDNTAVDLRADVDATDKSMSDEKDEQQQAEDEQEQEEAKEPEAVSNILVTVDESSDQKDEDEDEDEKITDAEPADAVPVRLEDSQPQEEVKEADLLQMSDTEQQQDASPVAETSSAPEDEQTLVEPEVSDRPESPPEAEPEATPADEVTTEQPQETVEAEPEVPASPTPAAVPCEEEEPEITQTTATLEDNDDNAVEAEDKDTSADTQEEPSPAAQEETQDVSTQEESAVGAAAAREDTETADNASDEEQPTFIEHPSPTVEEAPQVPEEAQEEAAPEAQSNLRSGATGTSPRTPPGDITRADDKFDDGIESVQSISNIKNRFQNKDEKPPMPGDSMNRSSRSSNGHVNGDRTPPEVVNRSESQEDILGRELPPVNMARSMASKFRDMESSDSSSDRKPVRKMTPPRDDVERDVGRYNEEVERRGDVIRSDEPVEKEDERPPPSFTRNMLAKFKEMEDTERPPPSPARSATSPTKRTHRPIATHIKSSPDEGIADTEPVNGHRGAEVIREADKNETEELPERGFTKSLVSQWRQIEQTAGGPTKSPLAPRQHGSTPSAVRNATTYRHASPANSESDEQREVVRESDNYEEENLPPPSYTKNMLAKFQNMQEEAQRDPATTPTKKQFKWTVKETKPLWAPPTGKDELQPQSVNGHDETYEDEAFSSEEEYEDTISLECDEYGNPIYPVNHPQHPDNVRRRKERRIKRSRQEVISSNGPAETEEHLPAPETTKKLLSQFKSMEDVSAPPPTPEMSVQRQRSTRSSISAAPKRYSTSSMESREQPDGIETTEISIDLESSSEERTDVVREADSDVAAELPEQGTTRNLLARFQSLQAV